MELNKRCVSLLRFLIQQSDFIALDELAKSHNVTERAIRYDIEKIEAFLLKNGYGYLERERRRGVKLSAKLGLDKFIVRLSNLQTPYQYAYSTRERFAFIATKLLQSAQTLKIDYFLRKLQISKNTALKELNLLQNYLDQRGLIFVRKTRMGLSIEGSERQKRTVLRNLLVEFVQAQDVFRFVRNEAVESKTSSLLLSELFASLDCAALESLVLQTQERIGIELTDESAAEALLHLAICAQRAAENELFEGEDADREFLGTQPCAVCESVLVKLLSAPPSSMDALSADFAALLLRLNRLKGVVADGGLRQTVQATDAMISFIEQSFGVSFGAERAQLKNDLLAQIQPMQLRNRRKTPSSNPVHGDFLAQYGELQDKVREAAEPLIHCFARQIDEAELSLLSLLFAAALHKHTVSDLKVRVVLAANGTGEGKLVAAQLEKLYNVEIVRIVSARAAAQTQFENADTLISTGSIPGLSAGDYIQISPLLTKEDCDKLGRLLGIKLNTRKSIGNEIAVSAKLVQVVGKYCEIRDKNQLQHEFLYELIHASEPPEGKKVSYRLEDLIRRELIDLRIEAQDWQQAIRAGTDMLVRNGFADEGYPQRIIETLMEYGPYMVLLPGVVLAHAAPQSGCAKLGMSIVTLRAPVRFGHREFDPVRLIVTLCAVDKDSHLKPLIQLFKILSDSYECKLLQGARTKEDVLEIVHKYSK